MVYKSLTRFKICCDTSSTSKAFNAGNGRCIANNSMTGSPFTRTTKFPRPGFSGLIATVVSLPMAATIFFARVINADHCLQASIVTTAAVVVVVVLLTVLFAIASVAAATFLVDTFAGLVVVVAFFTLGFDTDADAGGGRSFFAAEAIVRPPPLVVVDRVDRTIV